MCDTVFEIPKFIDDLASRIKRMLISQGAREACEGVGIVVPGMVDLRTGAILNARTLGWRNVDIRDELAEKLKMPVQIENAGRACAIGHLWLEKANYAPQYFVYVNVSDGVGIGIIRNGEVIRGNNFIAGEFGHLPL